MNKNSVQIKLSGCFHYIQLKENSLLEAGLPFTKPRFTFTTEDAPTLEFEEPPVSGKSSKAILIDSEGNREELIIRYQDRENTESLNKVFALEVKNEPDSFYYTSHFDFQKN